MVDLENIGHDATVPERENEALAELHELWMDIRRASEDTGYGFFPGGDPNNFTPDPECSTEEERERHKQACAAWPEVLNPAPHCQLGLTRPAPPGFGLGTYQLIDEQACDWAERLERCIARLT
jgi:hypothetical protein